jgi:hypothetical protein
VKTKPDVAAAFSPETASNARDSDPNA